VALLPIGYPAEVPLPVGRRPLAEVVRWESFETLPDRGFGSRMGRGIMPLDASQGVLRCSLRRSLREGGTGPALPE
jgi:hypothetical protein